jgi:hypothetical protein
MSNSFFRSFVLALSLILDFVWISRSYWFELCPSFVAIRLLVCVFEAPRAGHSKAYVVAVTPDMNVKYIVSVTIP